PLLLLAEVALAVARQRLGHLLGRLLDVLRVGAQEEVAGAVVVGRVEGALLADDERAAVGHSQAAEDVGGVATAASLPAPRLLAAGSGLLPAEQLRVRQVLHAVAVDALVPGELDRRHALALRELEDDARPGRAGFVVEVLYLGGDDAGRVAELEGHEGHVGGVAAHVAQGTGAEVPPAAPAEMVVGRVVLPEGGGAEELVPVDAGGRG